MLARIASRAKGIVTHAELIAAGISPKQIKGRLRKGLLIAEFRGVYRVGHAAANIEATYMAATKACGQGAVLSGRAAAWLWGLIKGKPPPPEVSAPTERRIPNLKTRHRRLQPDEVTSHRGIPITSVPITLLDLTRSLPRFELGKACHEAGFRYGTTPRMVDSALRRRPNTPGARKLRAILTGDARISLSRMEKRFLELLEAEGLPLPIANKLAGGRRVDCRWPEHRVTVELDSYAYHSSRHAWEQDRMRERQAYARGDEFRRYTWADVFEHPRQMLGELWRLLPRLAVRYELDFDTPAE